MGSIYVPPCPKKVWIRHCKVEKSYINRVNRVRCEILVKDRINAGWNVHLFAIEVAALGYAACLLRSCLSKTRIYPENKSETQSKGQAIYHAGARSGCGFKKWILIGVIQREGKNV